jgi:23S rRNA (cytidine2498-2'-O)-methyltransferase
LIHQGVLEWLQRKRRGLLRSLQAEPSAFSPAHSLVQILLTSPVHGFVSVAPAPLPFALRRVVSPFPKGEIPIASDKAAPSRAFAKLVEAELRLGRPIGPGERCVDLGASPGSWSYVALHRGARVIAVDRVPLRADLMRHASLVFRKGDAFGFKPEAPVDWLLCDVIAAPERSIGLLMDWLRERRARRFVVTIKFKGREDYAKLEQLKHALPRFCSEFFLMRLCSNKNEACAFGEVRQ